MHHSPTVGWTPGAGKQGEADRQSHILARLYISTGSPWGLLSKRRNILLDTKHHLTLCVTPGTFLRSHCPSYTAPSSFPLGYSHCCNQLHYGADAVIHKDPSCDHQDGGCIRTADNFKHIDPVVGGNLGQCQHPDLGGKGKERLSRASTRVGPTCADVMNSDQLS